MKKLFDKLKNVFIKNKEPEKEVEESEKGLVSNEIYINYLGKNTPAFNEVVKMFCDELNKQLGVRINPEDFMERLPFKGENKMKFILPIHLKIRRDTEN